MNTIIRLHAAGDFKTGVYRARLNRGVPNNTGGGINRHPAPGQDSKLSPLWRSKLSGEYRNWYFGFETIEQVRRWFYEDDFFRDNLGLVEVSVVRVLGIESGYTQAIFDIRRPRTVKTYTLEAILDWDNREAYRVPTSE